MFSLFSTLTKPRNLRAYLPISYESARNLVVTKLEAGAAAGNNTAMAFNREISKGELWDWLPISENLYSFLTKVFLTFPNDEVKNVIVKLVEKDTDFDPRQINLNFLDPNEVFSTHWKEITNNLVELFTESDLLTGELAIQRFFKAYNAKTTIKSDLITFAPACVGSYVATLQGLYLNYVLKEIRAHDGNRIVNTPNAQILIDYYSELLKKLFAKTIAEVRLQVGEAIDKKIIEDNNKTELQNIFDAKIISPPEKDFIIDMVDKFDIDSDSLLSRMTEDIKDFYSADVSYLDRYFLLKMLE